LDRYADPVVHRPSALPGGRYRHPYLGLLLLCLGILAACSDPVPSLPPLAPDGLILAFGDSLTYGTGTGPDHSYPAALEELTGREVINAGEPGELSAQGLARLPGLLDEHRPALLILCHGGNDLLRRRSTGQAEQNLRQMIALAHARDVPVVLVGVPGPSLLLSSEAFYERIASDLRVPYEGSILPDILGDNTLKSDRVHPNGDGYRQLAEAISRLLHEAGAI